MIVLDTHALVFDALSPSRLSRPARKAIEHGFERRELACSDISLWEIAMLIARGRLNPQVDAGQFLDDMILGRCTQVLPITAAIAVLSQSDMFAHGDPADRLIAATAHFHQVPLVTSDARLRDVKTLATIW